MLSAALAATGVGWLVAVGFGLPDWIGVFLFALCLGLLAVLVAAVRYRPPPRVPPMPTSRRTRAVQYAVVLPLVAVAGLGRVRDDWTLIEIAIAPMFVLMGSLGVYGVRRIATLWPTLPGVLAGEDDLPEDEL